MVQIYHGYILHSSSFPTTPHTPKSELKRRSYDPDKLDRENFVAIEFYVATEFSIVTEKTLSPQKNCVATKTLEKKPKKVENRYFGLFSSPFHPRTINTLFVFKVFRATERWENTSHGVFSLNCPFFSVVL